MVTIRIAIAHLADSRSEFYSKREALVQEQLKTLDWLRGANLEILESEVIMANLSIDHFAQQAIDFRAQSLIVHLPIWADPIFTIRLSNHLKLPILLLGNDRPETSSTVGLLGAGGALDQVGMPHERLFEHDSDKSRRDLMAFVRASASLNQLRGQTLGLFGGRSLGIFTATADPAQWQSLFGVDILTIDQLEIVQAAECLPDMEADRQTEWLLRRVGGVEFNEHFSRKALERQVRSYIATRQLIASYGLDFVGVKCQPEMSDGYVTQCVAHMLTNGNLDANGAKETIVHACEADADGALTMQILHLLSEGKPTALLDLRWYNREKGIWTLANCGAMAAAFFATKEDPDGLSCMRLVPHVFGKGGGGAMPAVVAPQQVTLARLCRKSGDYWMAIVAGQAEKSTREALQQTTGAFPQTFLRSSAGLDFAKVFGSNHIHMVSGDYSEELITFCRLAGIDWRFWSLKEE
jgi:L-fucose isomerase